MAIIGCTLKSYFNREIVLPVVGVVKIDEGGCFEISDDLSENFLQQGGEIFFDHAHTQQEENDEIKPQVKKEDLSKSDKDEIKPQVEEGDELNELNSFKELLAGKNLKELKDLASQFDKSEWSTLKKAELQDYLLDKLV